MTTSLRKGNRILKYRDYAGLSCIAKERLFEASERMGIIHLALIFFFVIVSSKILPSL
jgi:hypothetical protein